MSLPAQDLIALSRLLDEALALPPGDRAQWLDALPAGQAHLKPMLAQLLQDQATRNPQATDPAWTPRAPGAVPRFPQAGERIGPYLLVRELGRGGMGTVWRAERADGLFERRVALKLPHATFVDTGLAQRVARERAVLAGLTHPNIAHLHDAGWADGGRPYLALEYVEGQPIDVWCNDRSLDARARVLLYLDVVRAVAYAHARLVIHRDIKPANILVTLEGRAKLLDFGIAKLLAPDEDQAGETELTRMNGRPLTPKYAAPEQIHGEPVSTATDIYALGVVLYELLAQKSPYRLDTRSRKELEDAVLTQDPAPPSSTLADATSQRVVRGDLDAIVLKALKKRADERYATAAAFADDLERWLTGRTVSAQRDSVWYRARRFAARNRVALVAGAAVTATLLVASGVALWQSGRTREEAAAASATRDVVLAMIQRADPRASEMTRAEDRALLVAADERVERDLAAQPALQLRMRVAIAHAYKGRGDDEAAARVLRAAIEQAGPRIGARNLDLLAAKVMFAEHMAALSEAARGRKLDLVLQDLDAAIEALIAAGKPGEPLLVDAFAARITLRDAAESNDPARTEAELRRTLRFATEKVGIGDERTLRVARRLARVLANVPALENASALAILGPVIAAAEKNLAPAHPDLIEAQALRGRLLCALDQADHGMALLAHLREAARNAHGVKSGTYRTVLRETGLAFWYRNDLASAIGAQASAYALLVDDQPFASEARASEALALARQFLVAHRPADAEPFIDEADAAMQAIVDPNERANRSPWVTLRRAWMLYEFGDPTHARQLVDRVLAKAMADGNLALETVARRLSHPASQSVERLGAYVGGPALPAEKRIADVLRRVAVLPDANAAARAERERERPGLPRT